MSSNCPPQLHLSLPSASTSFKRSFEQFGFDLESPGGGLEASGSGLNRTVGRVHLAGEGNERSKRARSTGSSSDSTGTLGSSRSSPVDGRSSTSSYSTSYNAGGSPSASSSAHASNVNLEFITPSRPSYSSSSLPTHVRQSLELSYPPGESRSGPPPRLSPTIPEHENRYTASYEQFVAFDRNISPLRQSDSRFISHSPLADRSSASPPSPPPTLPPLSLSIDSQERNRENTASPLFLIPPSNPSPPLPESYYSFIQSSRPYAPNRGYNARHHYDDLRPSAQDSHIFGSSSSTRDHARSPVNSIQHQNSFIGTSTAASWGSRSPTDNATSLASLSDNGNPFTPLVQPGHGSRPWSHPWQEPSTLGDTSTPTEAFMPLNTEPLGGTTLQSASVGNDSPSPSPVGGRSGRLVRETEAWLNSVQEFPHARHLNPFRHSEDQTRATSTAVDYGLGASARQSDQGSGPWTGGSQSSSSLASALSPTNASSSGIGSNGSSSLEGALSSHQETPGPSRLRPLRLAEVANLMQANGDSDSSGSFADDSVSNTISRRFSLVNDLTPVNTSPEPVNWPTQSGVSNRRTLPNEPSWGRAWSIFAQSGNNTNQPSTGNPQADAERRRTNVLAQADSFARGSDALAEAISRLSDNSSDSPATLSEGEVDTILSPLRNFISRQDRAGDIHETAVSQDTGRRLPLSNSEPVGPRAPAISGRRQLTGVAGTGSEGARVNSSEGHDPGSSSGDVLMSDSSRPLSFYPAPSSTRGPERTSVPNADPVDTTQSQPSLLPYAVQPPQLAPETGESFHSAYRRSAAFRTPGLQSSYPTASSSQTGDAQSRFTTNSGTPSGPRQLHSFSGLRRPVPPRVDPLDPSIQRFAEPDGFSSRQNGYSASHHRAPSLPPLNFEDSLFSSDNAGLLRSLRSELWEDSASRQVDSRQSESSTSTWDRLPALRNEPLSTGDRPPTANRGRGNTSRVPSSPALATRTPVAELSSQRDVLHSFFTRQPRVAALRIEPAEPESNTQTFNHVIDGPRESTSSSSRRQIQLLEQLRPWGSIGSRDDDDDDDARIASGLMRRFSGLRDRESGAEGATRSAGGRPSARSRGSESPSREERDSAAQTRSANRARLRAARLRAGLHGESGGLFGDGPRFGMFGLARRGAMGTMGDYMRDEDFDASYESLISLSAAMGEVKPRATPEDVITSLDSGCYKDWVKAGSDKRCPICLDDYQPCDQVTRLPDCSHWLHKDCLEQWLRGAKTCPVCRKDVASSRDRSNGNAEAGPSTWIGGAIESARNRFVETPWRVL